MSSGTMSWRARARLAAGVAAVAAMASCAAAVGQGTPPARLHGAASRLVVATANGRLRGEAAGGIDEFLGIPYAAPPVGRLRWRAPQPAAHWKGVRSATRFGPHCPQYRSPFGMASMSENCLFLNVYTPSRIGRALPVLVWIHGGDLTAGESDDYNPAGLVSDGSVVVTVNYRLGALGFLAHPALASRKGGPSGDYGLMDQQAALRWVQRNIRPFGGNPRDVTIAGESAGGLSVLGQLVSPAARGLFARAIIESGSYEPLQPNLATAEASGEAFAAKAGCASQTASCLRGLPVQTILNDQGAVGPNIDGTVLPQSIAAALASGRFNRVPVIDGTNRDEWRLFVAIFMPLTGPVTAANYQSMIASTASLSPAEAAVVAARYPLHRFASPAEALGAVGTDAIFACPALTMDKALSRFAPTFAYEFSDEHAPQRFLPPIRGFSYGATHTSEIQYLFGLNVSPFPGTLTPRQQQLAAGMRRYWTSFARQGSTSSRGEPSWPEFRTGTQRVISLILPAPRIETGFSAQHQCAFWATARG
ncbi:MAG TPA: carboxylesterase family protein [Streptosporangiaceae bacterium]|nr:carboxylesterase family protein [Streptosporangiaceae bacterium]